MSPEEQLEIEAVSRELGDRLRRDDTEALKEVYARFAPAVAARLRSSFGKTLGESDLDDALSRALLRVWTYRQRYDPARASMYTWFYLIARSEALDAVRQRLARPQIHFSDLTAAQRGGLAVEIPITSEAPVASSPELDALQSLLAKLGDQDRQILLAFAEHEGREAWATSLAEAWHMPASTIRSKKRRAMERLRVKLIQEGYPLAQTEGESKMCAIAPQPAPVRQPTWPPAFTEFPFLSENAERVEAFADGFCRYYRAMTPDTRQGLAHFNELWSRASRRGSLKNASHRQFLVDTYRWLTNRSELENEYRKRLHVFIEEALKSPKLQRSTFAREAKSVRLDQVETSMASLNRSLQCVQPVEISREGSGRLYVRWTDEGNAELSWDKRFSSPISLRQAALEAFSLYGELPMEIASELSVVFLDNVKRTHLLLPPNFAFPDELSDGETPAYWRWTAVRDIMAQEAPLPLWIDNDQEAQPVPNPVEIDLWAQDRRLAEMLDELLVAAALRDLEEQPAREADKRAQQRPPSIQQLVEFVAFKCDCQAQEIAAIFSDSLQSRQASAKSSRECNANTQALHFLWSQLAEHD